MRTLPFRHNIADIIPSSRKATISTNFYSAHHIAINNSLSFCASSLSISAMALSAKFLAGFAIAALESVGRAVWPIRIFLVAVLDENDFAEFAKRHNGTAATAFPKRLMAFANGGAQFLAGNGGEILA
ncbi:MAG: hypothetical protein LBO00_09045, partial [Zoogloeaceae bacterium]|nr:hypothetical protein [Zoogloeaceae bacterium]